MFQPQALSNVRVLDLTQFEAGPSCTQMLAWLGADVVKIEPPGKGEQSRWTMTDKPGLDSYYFMMLNTNKRSITLDISSEEGRTLFLELIEKGMVDVIVENYAPGVMHELRLDYEHLRGLFPNLIYLSIKGFGSTGPYSKYKSFDMVAQATGGAMSVTGFAEAFPLKSGATIGDTGAALNGTIGVLAALYQRTYIGRGQFIDVSMQESVMNFTRLAMISSHITHAPAPRTGNRIGGGTPGDIFACRPSSKDIRGGDNDFCYILCISPEVWDKLAEVVGLTKYSQFKSKVDRVLNADYLHEVIEEWTMQRTKYEVFQILGDAEIPCGPVLNSIELYHNEHLRSRNAVVEVLQPGRGVVSMPSSPIHMSESPVKVEPAPRLGEHNDEIYRNQMHIPADVLAHLQEKKVI